MYRGTHGRLEVAVAHSTLSSAPLESLWGLKPIGPSAHAPLTIERKHATTNAFERRIGTLFIPSHSCAHALHSTPSLSLSLSLFHHPSTTASNPHESLEEPHSNPPLVSYHEVRLFWDRRRQFFSPL